MTDRHRNSQIMLRLPDELDAQLRQAALDHNLPVNWLINKALREFLDRLLPPEEVRWTR